MTTFEPCGFRAKRTGAMTPNLDSVRAYGPRNARGRKFNDEKWAAWVAENYEVVYRIVE